MVLKKDYLDEKCRAPARALTAAPPIPSYSSAAYGNPPVDPHPHATAVSTLLPSAPPSLPSMWSGAAAGQRAMTGYYGPPPAQPEPKTEVKAEPLGGSSYTPYPPPPPQPAAKVAGTPINTLSGQSWYNQSASRAVNQVGD